MKRIACFVDIAKCSMHLPVAPAADVLVSPRSLQDAGAPRVDHAHSLRGGRGGRRGRRQVFGIPSRRRARQGQQGC